MGTETEGGVLDIPTLLADYLLGFDRLYEHHTNGSKGDPPGSTTSATLKNQTGDILLFSRWQRKISQFYWFLLTVCYLWRYLKLKHGFLPMT
jgi:hypothetical protein